MQSIVQKHRLLDTSTIVTNKGGGSGSEAFVYAKGAAGNPHKVVFATNNVWILPLGTAVALLQVLGIVIELLGLPHGEGQRPAQQAERHTLSDDVAIYNLAGSLTVEAGTGALTVELARGGADAARRTASCSRA